MSQLAQMAKIIALVSGLTVTGYASGDGAYYNQINLASVCERRVSNSWYPKGRVLNCDWPCLAAWGLHDPEMIGRHVLADLPGCGYRV